MYLLLRTILTFLFVIILLLFKEYPRALSSDMKRQVYYLLNMDQERNLKKKKPDGSTQNCHIFFHCTVLEFKVLKELF